MILYHLSICSSWLITDRKLSNRVSRVRMLPVTDTPRKALGTTCLCYEYLSTLNVFSLLLSSTPLRLCPFTPVTTDAIMSNADDFQDRPVRAGRLSPSPTTRTSVFPYTPEWSYRGDFLPRCKSSLGHMDYPFSLRDVRLNALSRNGFTESLVPFPTRTVLVLRQVWEVGTN